MMRRLLVASATVLSMGLLGSIGFAVGARAPLQVSQKGRAFVPRSVEIDVGDVLVIRNDDQYVHDIFVQADDFQFESGEQQVGQNVDIKFPHAGKYQVLCAIHPKMHLDVDVK